MLSAQTENVPALRSTKVTHTLVADRSAWKVQNVNGIKLALKINVKIRVQEPARRMLNVMSSITYLCVAVLNE